MNDILIVGAGKFAREVFSWVQFADKNVIGFYADYSDDEYLLDHKIYTKESINDIPKDCRWVVGVGFPELIDKLTKTLIENDILPSKAIVSKSIIGRNVNIGDGSIVCPNSTITCDVNIGKNCVININTSIGHDVTIGDNCVLCPNCAISGNVIIGDNCLLGTSVTIIPSIILGKNNIVGSMSNIVKNIEENGKTIIGNPAKVKV